MATASDKIKVSMEQFADVYIKVYNALFNDETGESDATLQDVVDHLNSIGLDITLANARQKVQAVRERATKRGLTLPALKRPKTARQPRVDDDALAAILSSAMTARQNLDQLD